MRQPGKITVLRNLSRSNNSESEEDNAESCFLVGSILDSVDAAAARAGLQQG
jgi:hypothetical protein